MTVFTQPASGRRMFSTRRSLTLKLTLAFLAVGLLGALLVALFVRQGTQRAFDQFVEARGRPQIVSALTKYYQEHGSWDGINSLLPPRRQFGSRADAHRYADLMLVGNDGRVIAGSEQYPRGATVPNLKRARGIPIIVDSTIVGWLIDNVEPQRPEPGSPEGDFLQQMTRAIIYSAIGATSVALLLGIILAQTLTRPLRELTTATQKIARGALGQQVAVRSHDELGVLAASFNQMSADLDRASRLRRQMTADVAHDLRTPLSVILGYTEALREGKLPAEQDIFDALHSEAQHLQRLIDDLRTLSLADAGELSLTRQPVSAASLLERAATAYRAHTQMYGITLNVYAEPGLPSVDVDPERMAQVLRNLLSNAFHYTPAGGTITLSAGRHGHAVRLLVRDTGSGIAASDLPHVFERFYRADSARQHEYGSSGLGLAIAKGIIEAHSGRIWVESEPGSGTTFSIVLPITGPTG